MQEQECGAGREATRKDEEKKEFRISNPVQNSVPTQNPAAALVSWCTGPVITVTEPTEHIHTEDVSNFSFHFISPSKRQISWKFL